MPRPAQPSPAQPSPPSLIMQQHRAGVSDQKLWEVSYGAPVSRVADGWNIRV